MADAYIQVAPDGAGKKMQTVENTVSGNSVHAEAVLLVNGAGAPLTTIPVSGPLTDAELRASPVPVSGSFTVGEIEIKNDTGNPVPISAASLPLPTGASTAAKQPALGTALAPSSDIISVQRPAITEVRSTSLESSHVLKAGAGQLVQLSVFNSGLAQFILLINATTLPANGAVTLLFPPIPIAAATILVLDLPAPLVASTGIVVCNSSTGSFTKTIGSNDCIFYAQVN